MNASLKTPRIAPTVALHWAMDRRQAAEISARARELKDASRETNRSIADYCNVTERSVAGWLSPTDPKPMTYENAEHLAEMFEVDVDWLWRGREKGPTPDMITALNGSGREQLDRIETKLDRLLNAAGIESSEDAVEAAEEVALADVPEQPSPSETDQRESEREVRRKAVS